MKTTQFFRSSSNGRIQCGLEVTPPVRGPKVATDDPWNGI